MLGVSKPGQCHDAKRERDLGRGEGARNSRADCGLRQVRLNGLRKLMFDPSNLQAGGRPVVENSGPKALMPDVDVSGPLGRQCRTFPARESFRCTFRNYRRVTASVPSSMHELFASDA